MRTFFWYLLGVWSAFLAWWGIESLLEKDRDNQLMEQGMFLGMLLIGAVFFTVFRICLNIWWKEPPK